MGAVATFRQAEARDAAAVAAMHADSWRRHYRGAYADAFLDGDVEADRLAVWTERLARPSPDAVTVLAETGEVLVGFVHAIERRASTGRSAGSASNVPHARRPVE